MSKDSYRPSCIYERFGIDTADQFIRKRQDKFISKFCTSDNLLCRVILADSDWREFWIGFSVLSYIMFV